MSLVAFCFMGAGGAGTALGSVMIASYGFTSLYSVYGLALLGALLAGYSFFPGSFLAPAVRAQGAREPDAAEGN